VSLLRGHRLAPQPTSVASYTSSVEHDVEIAEEVVKVNMAHMVALAERGVVSREVASRVLEALMDVRPEGLMDEGLEDVHMNLERWVSEKVGLDVAGWMNLAKSRNDQVAAAIRMRLRRRLLDAGLALIELRRAILGQCAKHVGSVMPGYTHLQRAQPITLALHLLAHHDALARDFDRLIQCYHRTNLSPMGAAALAGSSIPLDRRRVAELLGFDGLVENTVDAVSSRDFLVEALLVASTIMCHVSRLCEEVVLWSTSEFGFMEVPDEYASTSSIMPQKKNPVVAEVARARAYRVYSDLLAALTMMSRLPLSYNLDLQEVTPHLWDAYDVVCSTLKVVAGMVSTATFNEARMFEAVSDGYANATELANLLARKGVPFRQAHHVVGALVKKVAAEGRPLTSLKPEEVSRAVLELVGREVKVEVDELRRALDPRLAVEGCVVEGGPSPAEVERMVSSRLSRASADEARLRELEDRLAKAEAMLREAVKLVVGGGRGEG